MKDSWARREETLSQIAQQRRWDEDRRREQRLKTEPKFKIGSRVEHGGSFGRGTVRAITARDHCEPGGWFYSVTWDTPATSPLPGTTSLPVSERVLSLLDAVTQLGEIT